ncbi:hypothetical protein HN873_019397 [Arachis hypogaea]
MSIREDDVKNDSDNDLGDDFDYQPNAEDDAKDNDVDSLDSTIKSEEVCGVKRIADLMVEDIWSLEFRTEDEACQFYNAYSCWHGFIIRKDDVVRDNQGRIISRQLVCNKEGWRNMRYLNLDDRSREARSLTRTKCPAWLRVKLDYGCDFDEVQSKLVKLIIRLQSRKQGKSTPNVNVEGINDPFVVKSKGAPSKRSSWRKKRASSNCHKYGHYYKRRPDLMQHSVQGNPCDRSETNASAKDSDFSPERFVNSSRSFSIKSEHHSRPKTKPFKKGGTRKFTTMGMRNQKGNNNTFDVRSLHESSESIDIASMNGFFNKNTYSLTWVKESNKDYGNKQGSYKALFASMHKTL